MIVFDYRKTFESTGPAARAVTLALSGEASQTAITAVIGPSGSGKTSLAMMMAGLLKADTGYLAVGGTVFEDTREGASRFAPPEARGIGFVFQNHRLFPARTVRQNILFAVRHGRRSPKIDFDTVVRLLHLEGLLDRLPATLSGGQAQRVCLGRALLAAQTMLVMDEPTASLDPALRLELTDYIARIPEVTHLPVLYITHHLDEARRLTDRALVIENGRVVGTRSLASIAEAAFPSDAPRETP